MTIKFFKYQGTGNDFIIVDDREPSFPTDNANLIENLCDRRFGIGADGLMLLRNKEGFDFEMVYFNSDGRQSSMCGNGGRCISAFAKHLGIIKDHARFLAIDGPHEVEVVQGKEHMIKLKMNDVQEIEADEEHCYLNTGSPHYVLFSNNIETIDVIEQGRYIRYSPRFEAEGTNVNFVEMDMGNLVVRTYERGVEDETYSCGTGVTASVLAADRAEMISGGECEVRTKGGLLKVHYFREHNGHYTNVWLEGPAEMVFKGSVNV